MFVARCLLLVVLSVVRCALCIVRCGWRLIAVRYASSFVVCCDCSHLLLFVTVWSALFPVVRCRLLSAELSCVVVCCLLVVAGCFLCDVYRSLLLVS